jgi:hypothetical protein
VVVYFNTLHTVYKLIVRVLGVSCGSLVVLTTVGGEVVRIVAEVTDVAKGVAPNREAGARWLVAGTLIPIVTHVYEREPLGALGSGLPVGLGCSF